MSPLRRHWESSPDDPKLLDLLRDLSLQLGVSKPNVKGVRWSDTLPSGRYAETVVSDQPLFRYHQLVIAERMKGKLSPEEWKPLIASAIVYQRKMLPKLRLNVIKIIGLPYLLAVFAGVAVIAITHNGLPAAGLLFGGIALIFYGLRRYGQDDREARLQADIEASKVIGKESLLETLRKITGLGMPDVDERNSANGRLSDYPSPNDRILNLQA